MSPPVLDTAAAVDRARTLAVGRTRVLIGLAGAPGAGKSTLAAAVMSGLGGSAAVVPMDGFHLADAALRRLGLLDRKGAPETFDGWGYLAMLNRLRDDRDHDVYAPGFERTLEQPIAGSIAVGPEVSLVITEGNYLLLGEAPWSRIVSVLDEIWWVDSDPVERRRRLVARHVEFGKTPAAAEHWVAAVDDANTRLVEAGRSRADVVVR